MHKIELDPQPPSRIHPWKVTADDGTAEWHTVSEAEWHTVSEKEALESLRTYVEERLSLDGLTAEDMQWRLRDAYGLTPSQAQAVTSKAASRGHADFSPYPGMHASISIYTVTYRNGRYSEAPAPKGIPAIS